MDTRLDNPGTKFAQIHPAMNPGEDASVAMPSSAEPRRAGRAYVIATIAVAGIVTHLSLRWGSDLPEATLRLPLYAVLAGGGVPLVLSLIRKAVLGQFGSDLLAGISIVSAVVLGEYLAGALVVLMLSGGEALESYAVARASNVLHALASRMNTSSSRHHRHPLRFLIKGRTAGPPSTCVATRRPRYAHTYGLQLQIQD